MRIVAKFVGRPGDDVDHGVTRVINRFGARDMGRGTVVATMERDVQIEVDDTFVDVASKELVDIGCVVMRKG